MMASSPSSSPAAQAPLPAWSPLKRPVFRLLWGTWLTANVCMWMNDVPLTERKPKPGRAFRLIRD
ncbi:hypothetical protein DWG20_05865 [Crenobacter cavernae]|uniref:Uncharacterized protein n=1 Tax=Crenobacter cavernae TaxID=2290923 RepID=A0A345Y4Z8_9NEIS|nr:hypothetical protein DWG20_05865 [Crenobacter cavernae]